MSVTRVTQDLAPSELVVERVAEREGVDPVDLTVPLFEAVDPEKLDTIVRSVRDGDGTLLRVEFTYYGYDVVVTSDGSVEIVGDR